MPNLPSLDEAKILDVKPARRIPNRKPIFLMLPMAPDCVEIKLVIEIWNRHADFLSRPTRDWQFRCWRPSRALAGAGSLIAEVGIAAASLQDPAPAASAEFISSGGGNTTLRYTSMSGISIFKDLKNAVGFTPSTYEKSHAPSEFLK